jgi:hypothetical protein
MNVVVLPPSTEPQCCKQRMDLVATIQPFEGQLGLHAYACSTCGRTDSRIIAPLSKPK